MLKIKKYISVFIPVIIFILSPLFTGCFSDDDNSDSTNKIAEAESPYLICVNRNPGGVGIDLDSGKAYNIDDNADFDWDIRVKTYKGVKNDGNGNPIMAGSPFIKMKGTAVTAAVWATTGKSNYDAITFSDIASLVYESDDEAELDIGSVDTIQDGEFTETQLESGSAAVGDYYYAWSGKNGLKQEYSKMTIGETWKSFSANTDDTDDKIYIVKSDEGNYFKVMVPDFGPNSDIGESGYIDIIWESLE
ncbi:MAG: hypothetical protein JW864_07120 [Spirochaetes bacterium]|nr:hypothetical protein [Spirochaetota bacterium]